MLSSDNSFFSILTTLTKFWNNFGCILIPPAQTEISFPIFHPNVFFSILGDNKDFDIMYFQPYNLSKKSWDNRHNIQSYIWWLVCYKWYNDNRIFFYFYDSIAECL